ncbi:MAG: aminotransferase class I/II-fold pyridoxal phosphate-dependent enzyme [Parvularculaceae bacterium]
MLQTGMDPNSRLELSEDEMRALARRVTDMLVDHFLNVGGKPPTGGAGRAEMETAFREPAPAAGRPIDEVLDRVARDVFPKGKYLTHPRFFPFVSSPSNFVSVMADALAAGFNTFAGTWYGSAAAAEIELVVIDWLRTEFGMPDAAGGLFTSGGSAANLICLAAAREAKLDNDMTGAVVYASDQTHTAIERSLKILGFRPAQYRKLASDAGLRLDMDELRAAVAEDRAAGRRPFCVVATPGTINSGAVDPLAELADYCAQEDLWLHADGAFGAGAAFCERGKRALDGLARVDSLSFDPHKWLFQPLEMGCALVRDRKHLHAAFDVRPEYLRDVYRDEQEINFCDYGYQLTRSFRSLKLWMSLQVFGRDAFAAAVERGFALAETAEARLREMSGWTVVTPAQMATLTFRAEPDGMSESEIDAHNDAIAARIRADDFALAHTTLIRGRPVLRICTINPRTTEADIEQSLERWDRFNREIQQIRAS